MNTQFLLDLNRDQREAASCLGHCMTIAAPGSGKTKMLAAKASYLLSGNASVVAVTFTRDSALELRDRIIKQAGVASLSRLLVGTFHSIDLLMAFPSRAKSAMGSDILRHSRSSLKQPWTIVREGARRSAIDRALAESQLPDLDAEKATTLIEGIKSGQEDATPDQRRLVDCYTSILTRQGVIDFQDILIKTNQGMASGAITPLKCDYLLMDEFQDTDLTQFEWALLHAKAGTQVTAVGDDDQSIYGFRRALGYQGMTNFEEQLSATRVVLGLNYRSHAEILAPANTLIEKNGTARMAKALVSNKGAGGTTFWEKFSNQELEGQACADTVAKSLSQSHTVGVLARTNKRLDSIETQLVAKQIPYNRAGSDSILKYRETVVLVAGLNCLIGDSSIDAEEILAWCGVDEEDLIALRKAFGKSVLSVSLTRPKLGKAPIKDESKTILVKLSEKFKQCRFFVKTGGSNQAVELLTTMLIENAPDNWSKKILQVVSKMFIPPVGPDEKIPPMPKAEFLALLSRITEAMSGKNKKEADHSAPVSLMTAHSSKGLEFDMVWIVGAEEGVFPAEKGGEFEERRLFYVAMTRAKKHLWVSCAGSKPPSPCITDAGIPRVAINTFVTILKPS